MRDEDLARALRAVELDGRSSDRGWRVVSAAYRSRGPKTKRQGRRRRVLVLAAAALAVAIAAAAVTPPGRAVVRSLRQAIGITKVERSATLARLPIDRALLVDAESGSWLVRPTGGLRRLGGYETSTWSPRGLFVAATVGDELRAIEPDGTVRWRLVRRTGLGWPRWSPSGFRIAYKQGRTLRVVAGDGTGDVGLAAGVPADVAALAWRPAGGEHVLAYADLGGRVALVETDGARRIWATAPAGRVRDLCFTGDASALVVLRPRAVVVLAAADGRAIARVAIPPGPAAIACDADRDRLFALSRPVAGPDGGSLVVVADPRAPARTARRLFRGSGVVDGLAFAGDTLVASWPSFDQWLFLPLDPGARITAVSRVGSLFDTGDGPAPRIAGACCSP